MNITEYLYFLLPSALKRTVKKLNPFWSLFKVLGCHIGEVKAVILNLREHSMILTCPPELLPVFGRDYDMPRLKGEDIEAFRLRLLSKADIAKLAGTKQGLVLSLKSLGYEKSYIEPFYRLAPERWAEFIIWLRGEKVTGINDLSVIRSEVMNVKQATSKPNYGVDTGNLEVTKSNLSGGEQYMPICGEVVCGVYVTDTDEGFLFESGGGVQSAIEIADTYIPLTGTVVTSDICYTEYEGEDK